jgi:hypothetical protein
MPEPTMTTDQAAAAIATKTAPKITKETIEARIATTSYLVHDELTLCIITMVNGFMVVGKSAPASKANFDVEIGKRLAYDDAFRFIWGYEGYLLKETLYQSTVPAQMPVDATGKTSA